MTDEEYLAEALALATASVEEGGGPFGALVVKDGKLIGQGSNRVTLNNDPTAHAEVLAIRDACNAIQDFSLAGATLYASCEPCPMCLAAIHWARLDRIVYAASREDAAAAGFDDGLIAREMALDPDQRTVQTQHLAVDGSLPFIRWQEMEGKLEY